MKCSPAFFVFLTILLSLSDASVLNDNDPCTFFRESQFQDSYEDTIPAQCSRGEITWSYPHGYYSIHFPGANVEFCVMRPHYGTYNCGRSVGGGRATVTLRANPSSNAYIEQLRYVTHQLEPEDSDNLATLR